MIELLLVDDHTIFRSGLRRLLMDEPDIRVAEEASNGNDDQRKNRQYLSHSRFFTSSEYQAPQNW